MSPLYFDGRGARGASTAGVGTMGRLGRGDGAGEETELEVGRAAVRPSDLLRRKGFNPDIADKMSRYDHGIREKQKKGDEV